MITLHQVLAVLAQFEQKLLPVANPKLPAPSAGNPGHGRKMARHWAQGANQIIDKHNKLVEKLRQQFVAQVEADLNRP